MKTITVDDIMSWDPCDLYDLAVIEEFIGFGKTPLEILDLDIPGEDRLWVVLREEIIPARELHLLACDFAEVALMRDREAGLEPHEASWEAIRIKRLWVDGLATDQDARNCARKSARNVAWYFGLISARVDALNAARDSAWDVESNAAKDAAWYASWELNLSITRKVLLRLEEK